jgi:putative salt-induced outer membrane protein
MMRRANTMSLVGRTGKARLVLMTIASFLCVSGARAQQPTEPAAPQPADAPATPPRPWTGTAGVGLSLTSGNSDTLNYNVAFDLTRDARTRNVMKWTGLYLRGTQNGDLAVDRTSLAYRDQYDALTQRMYVFGQLEYLRDTFRLIDYLVGTTGGVGYKVVDTDMTKLAVDGGAGIVWEKNPGRDVRTSAALTAGETMAHPLTKTASIKQAATALWKADDLADGLYTFSGGLATKVSERLQLSIDLLDTFKNRPPTAATKKNDIAIVMAVTAKY